MVTRTMILAVALAACGPKHTDYRRACTESIEARARGDYADDTLGSQRAYDRWEVHLQSCKELCHGGDQASCAERTLLEADLEVGWGTSLEPFCKEGNAQACEWLERNKEALAAYIQKEYGSYKADDDEGVDGPLAEMVDGFGDGSEGLGFGLLISDTIDPGGRDTSYPMGVDPGWEYLILVASDQVSGFEVALVDDKGSLPLNPPRETPDGVHAREIRVSDQGEQLHTKLEIRSLSGPGEIRILVYGLELQR